ncbi:MAG: hypothetical protein HYV14_11080 [Elusimicrobia bacterium]|nr:hypothetical protein [Elusimicrobiota bacterium]
METRRKRLYFFSAVLAVLAAGGAFRAYVHPSPRRVAAHTEGWDNKPRTVVQVMMERYGSPDVLSPGAVTWSGRGPWKRIVVRDRASGRFLEQTVGYWVPLAAIAPLSEFGRGVRADFSADELTAASEDEALNRLALNVAHDIAAGRRDAKDAARFYDRTVRLAAAGKGSVYLTNLLFKPYAPEPGSRRRRGVGYY